MSVDDTPPFPPDEYMALVCGALPAPELVHWFQVVGYELARLLDQQNMLGEHVRFLDIGCGCGRVARYLIAKPLASYVGFDRHQGMIGWCLEEISSRSAKFDFRYFDIKSSYEAIDGQAGEVSAETFKFPFDDCSFDSVLLASVFTHMPLVEIDHYLREIRRVLNPTGAVLLTIFFSESEEEIISEDINFLVSKARFLDAVASSHFHPKWILTAGGHYTYVLRPLPMGFNPAKYLALHKDVADAGMDPAEHYLSHGREEGRRLG